MKGKGLWWVAQLAVLELAVAASGFAQKPRELYLRGTISDYTPITSMPSGPWEVRGQWSLHIKWDGKADFYAALNMERSDQGILLLEGGDLNSTTQRNAHTHHITLKGATVSYPSTGGIEISGGTLTITANGGSPPFEPPPSTLTINVTGGSIVTLSNIKLFMGGGAANHFGMQAVNGVVRSIKY
ncbi:MAG TPA: hypothetical protein VLW06_04225 [Terriglobales bacterium]|nr:hypothetical protein [Terriglobales bacterium]